MRDLLVWMGSDHEGQLDPVLAAGMAHSPFETLHAFNDGNGRLRRLMAELLEPRPCQHPGASPTPG